MNYLEIPPTLGLELSEAVSATARYRYWLMGKTITIFVDNAVLG